MKKLILFAIASMLFFTISCEGNDELEVINNGEPILQFETGGEIFIVPVVNVVLRTNVPFTPQIEDQYRRMDIFGELEFNHFFSLTVVNWDWQTPPEDGVFVKSYGMDRMGRGEPAECKSTVIGDICDYADAQYAFEGIDYYTDSSGEPVQGIVTVTDNNTVNKTISGEFEYTLRGGSLGVQEVLNFKGFFANLPYEVN